MRQVSYRTEQNTEITRKGDINWSTCVGIPIALQRLLVWRVSQNAGCEVLEVTSARIRLPLVPSQRLRTPELVISIPTMDVPKFDPSQADYPLRINPSTLDQLGRIAQYLQPFLPPNPPSQRSDNGDSSDLQADDKRKKESLKNVTINNNIGGGGGNNDVYQIDMRGYGLKHGFVFLKANANRREEMTWFYTVSRHSNSVEKYTKQQEVV
ncbi:unnamed protein product [Rodentolepis nana]|uniref:Uncharacterized protein n=1 Tax=Rodentolepis nana TaxID=102285 RepID=A0A0R3T2J9_RODNA|nr:unnamed protein product [Rodentolepis nana]